MEALFRSKAAAAERKKPRGKGRRREKIPKPLKPLGPRPMSSPGRSAAGVCGVLPERGAALHSLSQRSYQVSELQRHPRR